METVTQWFGMDLEPKHKGIYEMRVLNELERWWSYWDGKFWRSFSVHKEMAAGFRLKSIFAYNGTAIGWRGIAK